MRRTGDIGLFKIVGESAVAAGVRRIEVVTGEAAEAHVRAEETSLSDAAGVLKVAPDKVAERVQALLDERKALERQLADARKAMATGGGASAGPEAKEVGGVQYAARALDGVPPKDLKPMADELKKKIGSGVVALVSSDEGKASIVVGVTDDLTDRVSAVDLVRVGSAALGGKGGGGRPDMAQAGGPDASAAALALAAIEDALAGGVKAAAGVTLPVARAAGPVPGAK